MACLQKFDVMWKFVNFWNFEVSLTKHSYTGSDDKRSTRRQTSPYTLQPHGFPLQNLVQATEHIQLVEDQDIWQYVSQKKRYLAISMGQ